MTEVVAMAPAQWVGRCTECRVRILKGNVVFKVATEGPTTHHGQGPGRWVCGVCAHKLDPSGALAIVQAKL